MSVRQLTNPTGAPVPLIMRGMGSTPRLVSLGAGLAIVEVIQRVFKKGRTKLQEISEQWIESYAVSAMLLEVNGKEIIDPKSRKVMGEVNFKDVFRIRISDVTLSYIKRPANRILISALRIIKGNK
tara:strand:+ start:894 stop:1271 length:378 start_codon:yes stop_codon:yes gene_type:complete